MAELSIFVDESGSADLSTRRYLVTLFFHDQSVSIDDAIGRYEASLREKGLPNIPFHASPLINGNDEYKNLEMADRKRLWAALFVFTRTLPVSYRTFSYLTREFTQDSLRDRIERDIKALMEESLAKFQSFEAVKIYYDGGQSAVTQALHGAIDSVLSKQATGYRKSSATQYRLSQVADFVCTVELTALKYEASEQTQTDGKFFGMKGYFKKNLLKKVRMLAA